MDLDLRKLRYFVAVAEHLNFGRAAEQLHIAQPVLSRQIRALEQELNVTLFVRGNRGTELTAAGQALLEDARHLLSAADGVRRRVVDAGSPRRPDRRESPRSGRTSRSGTLRSTAPAGAGRAA